MKASLIDYMEEPGISLEELYESDWNKMLKGLLPAGSLDEFFCIQPRKCICLTGDPGTGKRTLARAFAGSAARFGYTFGHVTQNMLCVFPPEERQSCLRGIIDEAGKAPCVLMIEPQGQEYIWRTAAEAFSFMSCETSLIIIFIEDRPETVCPAGLPGINVFLVEAPNQEAREAFFAEDDNRLMRATDSNGEKTPSYEYLACETQGLTYADLKQVISMIRFRLKQRALSEFGGSSDEIVNVVLNEYTAGRFCYTKEMFRSAVRLVREMKKQTGKDLQIKELSFAPVHAAKSLTVQKEQAAEDLPVTEQTEDEIALNQVLAGLRLPPDPRKNQ